MIKAVIFDYDDTLVKTIDSKWAALQETGKRFYNLITYDLDQILERIYILLILVRV